MEASELENRFGSRSFCHYFAHLGNFLPLTTLSNDSKRLNRNETPTAATPPDRDRFTWLESESNLRAHCFRGWTAMQRIVSSKLTALARLSTARSLCLIVSNIYSSLAASGVVSRGAKAAHKGFKRIGRARAQMPKWLSLPSPTAAHNPQELSGVKRKGQKERPETTKEWSN